MEKIKITFPSTWSRVACDEWMIQNELLDIGQQIEGNTWVYEIVSYVEPSYEGMRKREAIAK